MIEEKKISSTSTLPANPRTIESINYFEVLGVRFAALQIPDVIREIEGWITDSRRAHYVTVSNVHSVVESRQDAQLRQILNGSDLNVPDGMPIIWLGRRQGYNLPRRVYGPDLFIEFCSQTQSRNYRHFFYGGAPDAVQALVDKLKERFSGFQVAGYYSPPFRSLTVDEDLRAIEMINTAAPDVLWVGLGCPKQEFWMARHRETLTVPAMIGIGQAFDIYAGKLRQAPTWMRENGFEWLFRLLLEPRRLWRRYLVYNTRFIVWLLLETMRLRKQR
jgi:N-acetylglucosaminyldiphosphoundecaprenol N-acetyl-beta-D-mannosaminyltransferase